MKHTPITTDRQAAIAAADVANATRLIKALEAYRDERKRTPRFTRTAEWALFEVSNAAIALVDDGAFMAQRETLMSELGVDEFGYPADAQLTFSPAMVHPDDPCQGKGRAW